MSTLPRGTRVLIKSAIQMGIQSSAYRLASYAGKHLFVDTPSTNYAGCYDLCPESELDGEAAHYRMFNEKRKYHIMAPELCFIVDPVPVPVKKRRTKKTPESQLQDYFKTSGIDTAEFARHLKKALDLHVSDVSALIRLVGMVD